MSAKYVSSKELENTWSNWLNTQSQEDWDILSAIIVKVCEGVCKKFHPKNEDEYIELIHDAYAGVAKKVKSKKLMFVAGKAPVFNLLTTTIFNDLYSQKNKQKRHKENDQKYTKWYIQKHAPERARETEKPGERDENI